MYCKISPNVNHTALTASSTLLIVLTMVCSRKVQGKKRRKISLKDFSLGAHSFANVGPL
jgi:hypothetical protein